ncbi:hypothetical protein CXB51_000763 [Gossypium anomalum]|uniref:Indole-3-acetic acid-amido synthetase GH3.17-like n=1 Tax=Gossypium anomalum TaxID=47600 RepID=A0A8J6A2A4_9ROSI|nr:hypothetical protein CXB51_000763 [Gossypium anomalum]
MNVPIVTYEDIKPYIDRIANGEPSNILLAESVLEFFRSSGTSGGQPKLIPVTAETLKLLAISSALLTAVMKKHFGNIDQAVKSLEFQFAKEETETPCGLKARAATTSIHQPKHVLVVMVVMVGSQFATALLRAIKFLEGYWKELCSNIRSGVMSQYVETLEFYSGGLPLVSNTYVCSEAFCGINLEPLSGPSHVSYTFLPTTVYFEFLPVKNNSLSLSQEVQFNYASQHEPVEKKSNNENIEPIDLVHVKLGQYYELLVTSYAGDRVPQQYTSIPICRKADLVNAVREAKTLLDPLGFILTGFTSYADTCSIPGHYVLFWELKAKQGNDSIELDPKIMEECCYSMEEALYYIYRSCRKQNAIAALEIRVVKQGSLDALMDYYVSRGVSMSQYKTPSCIKSKEAINILESKVIGKFFSPKIPMS